MTIFALPLRFAPCPSGSYNTAYTLRANALALRDIAPYGRTSYMRGTLYSIRKPLKSTHHLLSTFITLRGEL